MTRSLSVSIGRIVLPAHLRGQEHAFGAALRQNLLSGSASTLAAGTHASPTDRHVARTADAIRDRLQGSGLDE